MLLLFVPMRMQRKNEAAVCHERRRVITTLQAKYFVHFTRFFHLLNIAMTRPISGHSVLALPVLALILLEVSVRVVAQVAGTAGYVDTLAGGQGVMFAGNADGVGTEALFKRPYGIATNPNVAILVSSNGPPIQRAVRRETFLSVPAPAG